ncbi:Proteasome assembly chaperone 2 [Mycena kentingensis (nom. inval.)]|nr:Proteasome assembly chaperone 2 [Mycena kentingensis (nom. inval.)]
MPFFNPTSSTLPLKGKTLVVPVVSTANVSQLAADLLIATLELQCIGVFDSSFLVPALGGREDGDGVTTPMELYGSSDLNVLVIQQRSPALKSHKQEFVSALLEFIATSGVAAALFLSGVDLSNRTDDQMATPTYHLLAGPSQALESTPLARLLQLPISAYTSPVSQYPQNHPAAAAQSAADNSVPFIPGGSLMRRIFQTLSKSPQSVAIAGLLQFVLEGDNRADAALLASAVVATLEIKIVGFKEPQSWKRGLFGPPPDESIYN